MADQADVDRWSALVAESYAAMCNPPLAPLDARDLVLTLDEPLAHCIMLALPPADWGAESINPTLDRWEQKVRRPRGPASAPSTTAPAASRWTEPAPATI